MGSWPHKSNAQAAQHRDHICAAGEGLNEVSAKNLVARTAFK